MRVKTFDIEKGVYQTQLSELDAGPHSHPAIEIIWASEGTFKISNGTEEFCNTTFAAVEANAPHSIMAKDCIIDILLIEHRDLQVRNVLQRENFSFRNGLAVSPHRVSSQLVNELISLTENTVPGINYDLRVQKMIRHIEKNESGYSSLIKNLASTVNLSPGRLSHLFKQNVGISVKKYATWCKLKRTINDHLVTENDLLTALVEGHFYDQPHFNRIYKSLMGVTPAKTYNSRIVQRQK